MADSKNTNNQEIENQPEDTGVMPAASVDSTENDLAAGEEENKPEGSAENRQWFVIHCYSGYENKVRKNLEQRIETMGMKDKIFDVVIPTQEEIEKNEKYIDVYCDSYVDFNSTFFSNVMVEGMLDVDLITDSTPKASNITYYEMLLQSMVYGRREYLLRLQKLIFDAGDIVFYQLSEEEQKEVQ